MAGWTDMDSTYWSSGSAASDPTKWAALAANDEAAIDRPFQLYFGVTPTCTAVSSSWQTMYATRLYVPAAAIVLTLVYGMFESFSVGTPTFWSKATLGGVTDSSVNSVTNSTTSISIKTFTFSNVSAYRGTLTTLDLKGSLSTYDASNEAYLTNAYTGYALIACRFSYV